MLKHLQFSTVYITMTVQQESPSVVRKMREVPEHGVLDPFFPKPLNKTGRPLDLIRSITDPSPFRYNYLVGWMVM